MAKAGTPSRDSDRESGDRPHYGQILADLYALWALDPLIEHAHAIAHDVVSRPHLYQEAPAPDKLVDFRMSYGTLRGFPNGAQRQAMSVPLFGRSDAWRPDATHSPFTAARRKLIDASIAFSERIYESGLGMLRERIRSAVVPLSSHLRSVAGWSVASSHEQLTAIFTLATSILTSPEIARVFGVESAPQEWPLDSDDPNGAKLVAAVGATLRISGDNMMSQDRLILLQRVAREGRVAVRLAFEGEPKTDEALEALVTAAYTWGTSLRDLHV